MSREGCPWEESSLPTPPPPPPRAWANLHGVGHPFCHGRPQPWLSETRALVERKPHADPPLQSVPAVAQREGRVQTSPHVPLAPGPRAQGAPSASLGPGGASSGARCRALRSAGEVVRRSHMPRHQTAPIARVVSCVHTTQPCEHRPTHTGSREQTHTITHAETHSHTHAHTRTSSA